MPSSWIGRFSIVKVLIVPNLIYGVNKSYQNPRDFCTCTYVCVFTDMLILKFEW